MVIRGRIQNGVVVLENDVSLPEGTEVTLAVHAAPGVSEERMSEEEHRQMIAEIERIAALPIEGKRDPFGGADHDKVLYGKP
jgi:hypothetical protein